jgi:hypothetical protein
MFSARKTRTMLIPAPCVADVVVPKSERISTRAPLPNLADLPPRSQTPQRSAHQAYHGHRRIPKVSHHPLPQTTLDLPFPQTYAPKVWFPNLNTLGAQCRPIATTITTDPQHPPLEACLTTGPPQTQKPADFTHTLTLTTCLECRSTSRTLSMNKSMESTLWFLPLFLGYQVVQIRWQVRITNRFTTQPTGQNRPDTIPSLRLVLGPPWDPLTRACPPRWPPGSIPQVARPFVCSVWKRPKQ